MSYSLNNINRDYQDFIKHVSEMDSELGGVIERALPPGENVQSASLDTTSGKFTITYMKDYEGKLKHEDNTINGGVVKCKRVIQGRVDHSGIRLNDHCFTACLFLGLSARVTRIKAEKSSLIAAYKVGIGCLSTSVNTAVDMDIITGTTILWK